MKNQINLLLLGLALILLFTSCNNDEIIESPGERYEGLAMIETGDPEIPYLLNHEDGTEIAVIADESTGRPTAAIISDGYENPVRMDFDSQGRIHQLSTDNTAILFDNYQSDRVDIAILDEDGAARIERGISLNGLGDSEPIEVAPRGLDDVITFLEDMGYAGSIIGCASGLATFVTAIIPCGSFIFQSLERLGVVDRSQLLNSASEYFDIVSYIDDDIQCLLAQNAQSCAGLAVSVAQRVLGEINEYLEERELDIDLARGALSSGDGAIKITLQWDAPVDLDLYVTDPFGETIYYGDKTSSSGGYLDIDDLDGFGPENVFYETGFAGVFTVEVNYYDGSEITFFKVRVAQAGFVKTYSGVLEVPDQTASVVSFEYGEPLPLFDPDDIEINIDNRERPVKEL